MAAAVLATLGGILIGRWLMPKPLPNARKGAP